MQLPSQFGVGAVGQAGAGQAGAAAAAPAPPPPPPPPPTGEPPEVELIGDYSWRNFFTVINFLKVLQKMSKHRGHRTFMLQQYKSSVSRDGDFVEANVLWVPWWGRLVLAG